MAEHNLLYQKAHYYDIVFERDVGPECDFLAGLLRRHAGREPASVLDIASGPGYHAREFSRRGLRAVGLDLREEMVEYARQRDSQEGLSGEWVAADMRDFQLEEPVDIAFTLFDGFDALRTNDDLVRHLRAVGRNLEPGGLYVVDLTHPRDCGFFEYGDFVYRGERAGVSVEIRWAVNRPSFDVVSSLAHTEIELRANDGGEEVVLRDSATERYHFPQELELLGRLSGVLSVVAWHGDFDLAQPLDSSERSRRMIAVYQKGGQA